MVQLKNKMKRIKKKLNALKDKTYGVVVGITRESSDDKPKSWFSVREGKPKKKQTYVHKKLRDWNTNDFVLYFVDEFSSKFKSPYGQIRLTDRKIMKQLLRTYGYSLLFKGITYLIKHHLMLKVDVPTIPVLNGYKAAIFVKAQNSGDVEIDGDKKQLLKEIENS